jgi:hypothetical protein
LSRLPLRTLLLLLLLMLQLLQLLRDPMRDHRDLRVRVLACMLQNVFLAVPLPLPLPLLCPSSLLPLPLCPSLSPCNNSLLSLGARLSISSSLYQSLTLPLSRFTSERSQTAFTRGVFHAACACK